MKGQMHLTAPRDLWLGNSYVSELADGSTLKTGWGSSRLRFCWYVLPLARSTLGTYRHVFLLQVLD